MQKRQTGEIMKDHNSDIEQTTDARSTERREFLRKSVYAAYATPFIMSMLVEKANAGQSWQHRKGKNPNSNNPHDTWPPPPQS